MSKKSKKKSQKKYQTRFIVTNNYPIPGYAKENTLALTRRVYSGRIRGVWKDLTRAHVFRSFSKADSCAMNVNRRSRSGRKFAVVTEIQLER